MNSWIDWSLDSDQIERFICAFDRPYSGSKTLLNSEEVRLRDVITSSTIGSVHPFQSGIIVRKTIEYILIALPKFSLIVKEVLNSNDINIIKEIRLGDRFYTPCEFLESSKSTRIFYDHLGENKEV